MKKYNYYNLSYYSLECISVIIMHYRELSVEWGKILNRNPSIIKRHSGRKTSRQTSIFRFHPTAEQSRVNLELSTCTGTRRAPDAFHPSSSRAHRAQHVPEEWTAQNQHIMNWTTLQVSVISSTLLAIIIFRKKIFHLFWCSTPSLSDVTRR